MNLCFVSKEFPPETGWGGVGTYFWELANGLVSLGHAVDVIALGQQDRVEEISANFRVHRHVGGEALPLAGKMFKPIFSKFCPKACQDLQWSWSAAKYCQKVLRLSDIGVIEVPDVYGSGYYFNKLGLPLVVKLHSFPDGTAAQWFCRQHGYGRRRHD